RGVTSLTCRCLSLYGPRPGELCARAAPALYEGEKPAMLPHLIAAAAAVPALWVGGDLLYSLVVGHLYRRWEAGIERDADGVRLGCREFTLGEGKDAVLLVHGFGDSPAIFRRIAPALAAKGFACHALRLP